MPNANGEEIKPREYIYAFRCNYISLIKNVYSSNLEVWAVGLVQGLRNFYFSKLEE